MVPVNPERRLIFFGSLLFLFSLLEGFLIPMARNPRLALSGHLEGILGAVFLILLGGVVWQRLILPRVLSACLFWLFVYTGYANLFFAFLGGVLGASRFTPIAGAGHEAPLWQEAIVGVGVVSATVAGLAGAALLCYGLRRIPSGGGRRDR